MSNALNTVSCRLGFLLVGLCACGPMQEDLEPTHLESRTQAVESLNGLSLNGLSLNGLSLNGLSLNGLSLNGLSLNGLSSIQFHDWFHQNTVMHDMVMKYVVRCAVLGGVTRTYTDSATGQSWSWEGNLGLAPNWSNGSPATLAEQRIVSACLAAHANKFGLQISISVQGLSATGVAIATSAQELQTFSQKEGCFFGNVFNDEGIYVSNDRKPLNPTNSTPRACAIGIKKSGTSECPPMVHIEPDCSDVCTLDPTGRFYVSCHQNGIDYPAITTRMLPSDIYTCGDGVCQISESCGTGDRYDNCGLDCGPCP